MKRSTQKASSIISVSERTADDIKRNFNLPCSKIHVVHSGIDKIFNATKDFSCLREIREHYKLPDKYILYVGNIEPKKNLSSTISLQKHLQQEGFPHKLVIVGKRAWGTKKELAEISKEVKSNNIVCTGYVNRNDLPYIYQMADIFVFPSLYEGFGFPPLEAMACGTPVISTYKGILNETVARAALIAEPSDLKQILQAALSIITNYNLRKKLINMGLEVSSQFNWEKTAEKTLHVYEKAIEDK
jgi:glycosyltransferase involved in cell wall biosynthesis